MKKLSAWGDLGTRVLREVGWVDPNIIVNAKHLPPADWDSAIKWLRLQSQAGDDEPVVDTRSAVEIAREAGYDLLGPFRALDDYLHLRRYYRQGEELCKFADAKRVQDNHIFWFVRHGAESIQPQDAPHRHDNYGTSVMSYEVAKQSGHPRLCNRYNHSAGPGCDNTLGSDVERIAAGLRAAMERDYDIRIGRSRGSDLEHAVEFGDGRRLYVHDAEINGVHISYAGQNALINGAVREGIALVGPLMIDLRNPRESINLASGAKCLDVTEGVRVVLHANEHDAARAHERRPEMLHVVSQRRPA